MKLIFSLVLSLICLKAFALPCDCEVRVYSPITGSHQLPATSLKKYELEEYGSYSFNNQRSCRQRCLDKFQDDMPTARLNALLLVYGQNLINEKMLGYNCTGLTTLKFPVRVKASLGQLGLGNVADQVHVVNHEEICF
jgi:hypothetical protein